MLALASHAPTPFSIKIIFNIYKKTKLSFIKPIITKKNFMKSPTDPCTLVLTFFISMVN
jgi:hypothetical protein